MDEKEALLALVLDFMVDGAYHIERGNDASGW
jgi:hypothetical protein